MSTFLLITFVSLAAAVLTLLLVLMAVGTRPTLARLLAAAAVTAAVCVTCLLYTSRCV